MWLCFFSKEIAEIKRRLEKKGHSIFISDDIYQIAELNTVDDIKRNSLSMEEKGKLIKIYYNQIKDFDAILVVNELKNGVPNYIGGNSFLEIGFAFVLGKKIFLWNEIPLMPYSEEIIAMKPIILKKNLDVIR